MVVVSHLHVCIIVLFHQLSCCFLTFEAVSNGVEDLEVELRLPCWCVIGMELLAVVALDEVCQHLHEAHLQCLAEQNLRVEKEIGDLEVVQSLSV